MRKGFLATLALLALAQAQGIPPVALPALALPALVVSPGTAPVARESPALDAGLPAADSVHRLPLPATRADPAPAAVPGRGRWPAALAPNPLEVPLRALAPGRAGELPLLGMR